MWLEGIADTSARGGKSWHLENRMLKTEVSTEVQVWAMTVGIDWKSDSKDKIHGAGNLMKLKTRYYLHGQ